MATSPVRRAAEDLLEFIRRGPSPWHAAAEMASALDDAGYTALRESDDWPLAAGSGYYVMRDGSSIVAFRLPGAAPRALRIVAAHTDSPGFRLKPRPAHARGPLLGIGVEIYGGPIVASFADRELTLAGRVLVKDEAGRLLEEARLVDFRRALLRLPNLAIHLNREVNEQGLKFEPQEELALILGTLDRQLPPDRVFARLLGDEAGVAADRIAGWELAVADTQPGGFFGIDEEFIASARLDNLASCHAGLTALLGAADSGNIMMCACFDHEEVGSQSYKGAEGSFLQDVVERMLESLGVATASGRRQLFARSLLASADMAHGFHPSFARYYDEQHLVELNRGPAIKINVKQRYATDAVGESYFASLCELEGVGCQRYVHRNNLPCGSTIGPIVASRLGIRTIDVGNPMWSMHSARESAGALDHHAMIRVLGRFLVDQQIPQAD